MKTKTEKKKRISPRSVHPFPARMAPDLAFKRLKKLAKNSRVLDPMVGSGTVLRQAGDLGMRAYGFDVDPLAVLMSRVATTKIQFERVDAYLEGAVREIKKQSKVSLPWIDSDEETRNFINYWFGKKQKKDLRRIAYVLRRKSMRGAKSTAPLLNLLKVAFSRLIITKERGASLARDVSHSRPHRVADQSDFDVLPEFIHSVKQLCKMLESAPPAGRCRVNQGDVRRLKTIKKSSVDLVMTSPPYLNAIDYMRGHRLSLVWLGYKFSELREIRSESIGAERGLNSNQEKEKITAIQNAMGKIDRLPTRHKAMVARYAFDVSGMMKEIARVLRPKGRAILVVGNSCLQNVFISNADAIAKAGKQAGLRLFSRTERDLPDTKRYLPIMSSKKNPLSKRMRTETILMFGPNT